MIDTAFLIDHGVTNLIEVDGLLYAPVSDLWSCFLRFIGECILKLGLVFLVAFLIVGLSWLILRSDYYFMRKYLDG